MGLKYYNEKEILANQKEIKHALVKETYFLRSNLLLENFKNFVKNKNSKILDMGCGAGNFAKKILAEDYKNLYLLDIDNYLYEDIKDRVNFLQTNLGYEKISFEDESFDVVTMLTVLEHLENPFFTIREVTRIMKKGGILFLYIPHIFNIRSRLKFLFQGDLNSYSKENNHISLFTKAIFAKVILKDFKINKTVYSEGYVKIFNKKIKFKNQFLAKYFGSEVLYILEKIN